MMAQGKLEAVPISRLFGEDRSRVLAWVYLWNTAEVSILWLGSRRDAMHINPPISAETLENAKAAGCEEVAEYLELLALDDCGN